MNLIFSTIYVCAISLIHLSTDSDFHFEILRDVAAGSYGHADVGEVLTAANSIVPGDFESFYRAFNTLANSVYDVALKIDVKKFPISARDTFFRASTYFRSADFYLHGNQSDPRIYSLWAQQIAAFDSAMALLSIPGKRVNITTPNGFYVPAIWYTPAGPKVRRPTVIIGGGYDGGQEELLPQMGINALERGWNVLTYEGPGQASVVRYQHLGFIFEWEKVVTPVVDYLYALDVVDSSAIALVGLSFGGILAPRASAFERRLAATLALDGLYEFGALFLKQFPDKLVTIFNSGNSIQFDNAVSQAMTSSLVTTEFKWTVDQGMWAFNTTSPFDWMTQLQAYTLVDVVDKIPGPMFVADSATDTFFTGDGAVLASKLGNRSTYYEFDVASGVGHAGVGGYRMQCQVAFDWLQGIFDKC
ncbi:related to hydrolases or acyltransferases (alpha/beta hydrolase superfamily) [Phialocephala subalpina]|uniref:Related to hydrolases or acyltransferases (Alpha/beta hydrolase superfamily) n=1 Tax=Phialocephala subalpina TaxID=576137 RepID=A0A1L7X4L4_9HELO|nr:related to hydrolases or acyltransferases (alpha/beta hydrolase superfamily) [Phialocephala subalpina]